MGVTEITGIVSAILATITAFFAYLQVRGRLRLPGRQQGRPQPPPPPSGPGLNDLFMAYVKADEEWAERLAADLRAKNVQVWLLKWEAMPGDVRPRKLEDGLRNSKVPAPVFSPRSVRDQRFLDVYAAALDQVHGSGERLIPIVMDGAERPPFAAIREPADFTGLGRAEYEHLVERLAQAALRAPDPTL